MKCEMFGCNNTEGVSSRTIAPGTTVKICDTCAKAEGIVVKEEEDEV